MTVTNILPVYNFSFPFPCNHIQQRLPQVIPNAAVAYNLISKNNQAQIVDILHIILLHIHTVLQSKHTGIKLKIQYTHAIELQEIGHISTVERAKSIFSPFAIKWNHEYPQNSKSVPFSKTSLTQEVYFAEDCTHSIYD